MNGGRCSRGVVGRLVGMPDNEAMQEVPICLPCQHVGTYCRGCLPRWELFK